MSRPKGPFVSEHGKRIRDMYVDEQKSMKEIVEILETEGIKTNTQAIWRCLRSLSVRLRDNSEAQKLALQQNRAVHPTEGKELSESNKLHLSESIGRKWAEISDEERQRRSEKAAKNYAKMSDRKKRQLHHAAAVGVRKSSSEGSKLELFLIDKLSENGYNVVFHQKGYIINDKLEIDILLPANKIAIEVDGITHFKTIHDDVGKVANKDNEKNGLLLNMGYVMIRLSNTAKTCSLFYMNKKWSQLNEVLEKIKNEFPPADQRLIYLGEV